MGFQLLMLGKEKGGCGFENKLGSPLEVLEVRRRSQ